MITTSSCVKNETQSGCNPEDEIPNHDIGESIINVNDQVFFMNAFFQEFSDNLFFIFQHPVLDSCYNEFVVDIAEINKNFEIGDSTILNGSNSFVVASDWLAFDILGHSYTLDSTKISWLDISGVNLDSTLLEGSFKLELLRTFPDTSLVWTTTPVPPEFLKLECNSFKAVKIN